MSTKKEKAADKAYAIDYLRRILKPGDSIACTVLHVARSGMSHTIMLQVPVRGSDGRVRIEDISGLVADAIGARWDGARGGLVMGGCGMNMGFAAVYSLGRVLFPDGFGVQSIAHPIGARKLRPKTQAAAARAVARGYVFRGRNGDGSGWDTDGGYALDHRG